MTNLNFTSLQKTGSKAFIALGKLVLMAVIMSAFLAKLLRGTTDGNLLVTTFAIVILTTAILTVLWLCLRKQM
ncbi:hypothetical protein Barb6_01096 [Bacteroidales bacterium Barb6]|nr:hypothetical protein Barb6_01096 [Bacteroidales bacterium Barb6]